MITKIKTKTLKKGPEFRDHNTAFKITLSEYVMHLVNFWIVNKVHFTSLSLDYVHCLFDQNYSKK